jgi:hypothetical protein
MSRIHSLLVFLPAALLTGCFALPDAKPPTTGAVATGEPLAVVDDIKVWTTTSKEKVGETVYKDRSGSTIATADTYEERTRVHSMKVWYPVQGGAQIPDEDFFRIAGEQTALDETMRMRARAQTWNRRGKITMGAGVVGFVVGLVVPHQLGKTLLITAGGVAVSTGWYMAHWGAKQMEPENHAVDRSIAERAARQYNQQLGTVGVAVGRSF